MSSESRPSAWVSLRIHWAHARGYQRLAYLVGAVLILTGLVHAAIWAVVGGPASGALSWRKPATFGISFGLTTATLGWVASYLPVRRGLGWALAGLLGASTAYEVAWVSLQHARGVPSHFNDATTLDESLFIVGAVAVAAAILVILATTVAAFTRTTAPVPMAWAIRSGLVALLGAQAVGVWMLMHGLALLDADANPATQSMSTYGAAGAMKFAHFVPMHAIQALAVIAGLLSLSGLTQRRQLHLVALAVAGYAGLFGVTLLRTGTGQPPFDPLSASTAGYLVAAGLLAAPAIAAVAGIYRRVVASRRET
ncbi:MAG: hypothetical protein GEV03_24705 [Streptosporangiales bacterium]|nr:hypothetical protein [Streptosporangiales bacterium]